MNFFDNHCDTVVSLLESGEMLQNAAGHINLKKTAAFSQWGQVFACFVRDGKKGSDAFLHYLALRECLQRQLDAYPDRLLLCKTAQDLHTAVATGRCAVIPSVENGAALGGSLDRLLQFQQDGIKLLTLTWFGENELGFGSKVGGKLKPFGKEVLAALPQYGIVPDISHLSDEGVEETFALYSGPLVASHSNVRAVTPHYRNLTDAQVQELVRRGGLIGLNFYIYFLNENHEQARMDDVYRHLDALFCRGAQNCVCFGTDFDGAQTPPDLSDISCIPALYDYLLGRNYSEALLQKVFFKNAFSFWEARLSEG